MSSRQENLVVGLDIGTTKICAIVGNLTEEGLDIVGIGTSPSRGLRKGVVINIDATVDAIQKALKEAERMAGCEISSVFAGIAGGHIKGLNSQGIIAIKNREVTQDDVRRVIDAAKAIAIPMDREVLHILPQEYIIDDQDGIKEPLGMSGVRLEARVHIVTGAVASAQNIIKCCTRAGVDVADIVLEQLASSEAVLAPDEKELGVALIDIGGGTTDIAIYVDGAIKHTAVLALGGNHLTNDIAVGLRTPMAEAERIKHKYGCCLTSLVGKDETIEVPSVGGRSSRASSHGNSLPKFSNPALKKFLPLFTGNWHGVAMKVSLLQGLSSPVGQLFCQGCQNLPSKSSTFRSDAESRRELADLLTLSTLRSMPQGSVSSNTAHATWKFALFPKGKRMSLNG